MDPVLALRALWLPLLALLPQLAHLGAVFAGRRRRTGLFLAALAGAGLGGVHAWRESDVVLLAGMGLAGAAHVALWRRTPAPRPAGEGEA